MTTNQPVEGSVSHGTMRPDDLLTRLAAVLRDLSDEPDDMLLAKMADGMAKRIVDGFVVEPLDMEVLSELFDRLNEIAGEGLYFGAHEGDGSDYGFWRIDNEEG